MLVLSTMCDRSMTILFRPSNSNRRANGVGAWTLRYLLSTTVFRLRPAPKPAHLEQELHG